MVAILDLMRRAARKARAFLRAENGGIAVQFAFLALPVSVLAFGMVDINRASVSKKDLQDALDAATLIAARSTATTNTSVDAVGDAALAGQLTGHLTDATLVSSSFTLNGSTVHGVASLKLTPIVANLWLNTDMTVGATSDVVRSQDKLEVALVLDNTGSMGQNNKLVNLKNAANGFIDELSAAAARSTLTNPIKIGIVPFGQTVKIAGTTTEVNTYKTAAWMDVNGNAPASKEIFWSNSTNGLGAVQNRFTLFQNMGVTWGGCVESRAAPYDVQDTAPTSGTPATQITPYFWPDEVDGDYNANNDYIGDGASNGWSWQRRQGNTAKYNTSASGGTSSGPNKNCATTSLMRLSTNWTALKAKVNSMVATGETHIPIGAAWGWFVLSPNAPFADGVPYTQQDTTKVMVIMTDGENTYSYDNDNNNSNYDGYGFIWQNRTGTTSNNETTRTAAIDARLTLLCTNAKAAGIVIYTVRVEVTTGTSALLQGCASSPDKFYNVQDSSNLTGVFSSIAGSIQNLRISG